MARSNFSARRVINGTYGTVWLDDERVAECHTCQAKVQFNTETINLDGEFMEHYKPISGKGSGSLTLYKVDSVHHCDQVGRPGERRSGAGGPVRGHVYRPDPGRLAAGCGR